MKVTIIGAGISGLVMGILLQQRGIEVHLYEKKPEVAPIGGGIGIQENPFKILMTLPCAEKILALSEKFDHSIHVDQDGKIVNTTPHKELNVCRSDLVDVLLEQFGVHNITFNAPCIGIDNGKDNVTAYFANGKKEVSDLLIGADGIHSEIRRSIMPHQDLKYSGYLQLAGVIENMNSEKINHNFIWGQNRFAISFPIAQNRYLIYQALPFPKEKLANLPTTVKEKINLFRGWSGLSDHLLDLYAESLDKNSQHFYCGAAHHLDPLTSWHNNRCVLIGDAAHPIGSLLGLGASTAIENCEELANQLGSQPSLAKALTTYEAKQMPQALAYFQREQDATRSLINPINKPSIKNEKLISLDKNAASVRNPLALFSSSQLHQKDKKKSNEADISDKEMVMSDFASSHTATSIKTTF